VFTLFDFGFDFVDVVVVFFRVVVLLFELFLEVFLVLIPKLILELVEHECFFKSCSDAKRLPHV
jgi:hypothetical protein